MKGSLSLATIFIIVGAGKIYKVLCPLTAIITIRYEYVHQNSKSWTS